MRSGDTLDKLFELLSPGSVYLRDLRQNKGRRKVAHRVMWHQTEYS
jgi:hypothetical protein